MKGPTTVLHVLDHSVPLHSGYSYRSRSIVEFQRRLGLRPVVLTSPKHGSEADAVETIDGLRYYRTAGERGRVPFVRELQLMARMASRVAAIARAERAAIIHAHSPVLNGLPALWAGRHLGLPVVYEARAFWEDAAVDQKKFREGSSRYRLIRALETYVFKRADRVAVICEGMRQELVARRVDGRHVIVIPNGVDTNAFQPVARAHDLAERFGLDGGLTLGYFGSFYHYEGLRFLLEALPELRRRVPGARLLLAGGGEEEATLRRLGEPLGNAVVFAGRVPHGEIRRLYSVIDVFVCPRRRMRLTELVTPLKPLEAMAMGKPVLASDVGGLKELVSHEATGLLFPAESGEAFVDAAARLGRDPGLVASLGQRARTSVVEERTWPKIVSRYLPAYAAVR
jgi:glycogen synthase